MPTLNAVSTDLARLFEANLELIDAISARVCRRNAFFGAEAEDFASEVRIKLMEDGYARLGKYGGKASFPGFLSAVIANLFRDHRIAKWGKFRPSAVAKREGPVAIQLETLTVRDGFSLEEAIQILRTNHRVELSADELRALDERLPPKVFRREVEPERQVEEARDGVEAQELARTAARAREVVARTLEALESEDRLMIRMCYEDGMKVSSIARSLGLEQARLYRRREACFKSLRKSLEAEGLDAEAVLPTLGAEDPDGESV